MMNKKRRSLLIDLIALGGSAAVVYGANLVYMPSAYIIGGLAVVTLAILRARRWS